MALFAMTAMKLRGEGFFTPVNLFAHTFWNDAPLDGTFVLSAFELGLLIHLAMSIGIGLAIAFLVSRGELDVAMVFLLALGAGAGAWLFQAVAWSAIDTDAHAAFTPWVLAVAHVVFAMGAATFLLWLRGRDETVQARTSDTVATAAPMPHTTNPRPTRSGWVRPGTTVDRLEQLPDHTTGAHPGTDGTTNPWARRGGAPVASMD